MTPSETETVAFFDRCAHDGVMLEFEPAELARVAALPAAWGLRRGDRVCEAGCGAGRLTTFLAGAVGPGGEVLALDTSAAMLDRAAARRLPGHARLVLASALAIPAAEASFDHVVCFHALPHFPDPGAALVELARVLVPGGSLWVCHLASRERVNALHASFGGPVADHRIPDDGTMRRLAAAAGLRLESIADGEDGYLLHARKPEPAPQARKNLPT